MVADALREICKVSEGATAIPGRRNSEAAHFRVSSEYLSESQPAGDSGDLGADAVPACFAQTSGFPASNNRV